MQTGLGTMDTNAELAYQASFGTMSEHTVYYHTPIESKAIQHPANKLPEMKSSWESKAALGTGSPLMAIGTSYSSTSGSIPVLLPTVVDSTLYDLSRKKLPLRSGLIPRVTNRGLFADYMKLTTKATAVVAGEFSALNASIPTFTRTSQIMSSFYSVGEVSGQMQVASGQQWKDAINLLTPNLYYALAELEEDMIINGNPTAGDYDGATTDNRGFQGLIQLITTNATAKAGAVISIQNITDAFRTIREAKGEPTFCVTDYKTLSDIKGLIFDVLRYPAPTATVNFGIENVLYEGVPIIPDLLMPTTATARVFLAVDSSSTIGGPNVQLRVLQEAIMEEGARTIDSYKFWIKEYLTMVMLDQTRCYKYTGLA